jgi:drug/metabolite transporter (DMT)-like permease
MPKSASFLSPIPLFFVFLWSTGFIVAKFGLPYAPPLMFLLLRFLGVLAILLPLVLLMRAPWPHGKIKEVALAGLLMQAGYLAGVWCAIKLGMPAGLTALIVGMQPILTAMAAPLIGETVRPRQWPGVRPGWRGAGGVRQDHAGGPVLASVGLVRVRAVVDHRRHHVPAPPLPAV